MHQEHSSVLSEELSLLRIELFLKGKKPNKCPPPKPAVTSAAEVTACFRNCPTSHQSCARVKRELTRSRHLPVILSEEAAASPYGSTYTEPGHWPTHPVSENLFFVSWLVKPECRTVTKGWVQPLKQVWSAPQYFSLSNLHHVTTGLTEKANSTR